MSRLRRVGSQDAYFGAEYQRRLKNLAMKARDTASVVSDGDPSFMAAAHGFEYRSYRIVEAGTNANDQKVWFCCSIHRDTAGCFYSWREVHGQNRMWRYQLSTCKTKAAAKVLAYRRQNAWVAKVELNQTKDECFEEES